MKAVIVAGAPVHPSPRVTAALAEADLLVAADSGGETALALGRRPDIVVGDFDSLREEIRLELESEGVTLLPFPSRKDKTDLHLAMLTAVGRGSLDITLIGILGGERADHGVAALLLLARDEFASQRLRVLDGHAEMWVVRDRVGFEGRPGDYVSILSLTPVSFGISTDGLEFPLTEGELTFGDSLGVSNALMAAKAEVRVREGVLAVIHQHTFE
jgi:thiamine pyrophosphokinase